MRKLLITAALLVASTLPSLAGVACYGGLSAGKSITETSIAGPVTVSASGLIGGVELGCDYAIGSTVIGALARYDFMDVSSTLGAGKIDGDAMWTLAARAGVKINPGTLVYGLAGISGTEMTYPGLSIDPTGITFGGGLEIDIADTNLSGFVEWSRTQWDDANLPFGRVDPASDAIRVGVRMKFAVPKALE